MLSRRSRRAYLEARRRRAQGAASENFRGSEHDVRVWMEAMDIADLDQIDPFNALLLAVKRRSARVHMADSIAQTIMNDHRQKCADDPEYGDPNIPPAEARRWLAESREEERMMTSAAKKAIDAGVAEAMIRRANLDGAAWIDAMVDGLDALGLEDDQRLKALNIMHQSLASRLPSGTQNAIEGHTENGPL